jgi:hypothetical protein
VNPINSGRLDTFEWTKSCDKKPVIPDAHSRPIRRTARRPDGSTVVVVSVPPLCRAADRTVVSRVALVFVVALLALAGCTGSVADRSPAGPDATAADSTSTATGTPDLTTAATPSVSNESAGERAIAAEKARIRNATADWTGLTDLSFGILRPAEYEIRERNASGVIVDVTVGYSTSFDCGLSVDGAGTRAQYLVTADDVRLVAVEQDVGQSPGEDCGGESPTPGSLERPL